MYCACTIFEYINIPYFVHSRFYDICISFIFILRFFQYCFYLITLICILRIINAIEDMIRK